MSDSSLPNRFVAIPLLSTSAFFHVWVIYLWFACSVNIKNWWIYWMTHTSTQLHHCIPLRSHSTATKPDPKMGVGANNLWKSVKPTMNKGSNQIIVITQCLWKEKKVMAVWSGLKAVSCGKKVRSFGGRNLCYQRSYAWRLVPNIN